MRFKHLLCAALAAGALSACGGDDASGPAQATGNTPANGNGGSSAPPTATTADKIEAMEQAGKLPRLDRSADVRGPDADANGIRDDIDSWIDKQGFNPREKKAAQQLAKALQAAVLVDPNNVTAVRDAAAANSLAIKCVITSSRDAEAGYKTVTNLEKFTANTKARVMAYLKYNVKLDGSVSKSPEGDGCAE